MQPGIDAALRARDHQPMKSVLSILSLGGLLIAAVWLLGNREASVAPSLSIENEIREACRRGVEEVLHDPARAVWDGWRDWPVEIRGNEASVQMTYRAPNAFGGIVRAAANCDAMVFDGRWVHWSIEPVR